MNNLNKLKRLSGYICKLYLKNINPINLYNQISNLAYDNIDDIIDYIYDSYSLFIDINKTNFKKEITKLYDNYLQDTIVNDNTYNILKNNINNSEEYCFEKMTYPLYLFTENLYFKLLKSNTKRVFFFAREGQFMKKLFDEFQKIVGGPVIKTEYLYVSRASTFLGTLKSIENEDFASLFTQYPHMSIQTFLKNLCFSDEEICEFIDILKDDIFKTINDLKKQDIFQKLITNERFISLYDKKRNESKNNFLEYLNQFDILNEKEISVVDVGWKGSIQNNIEKIIPNIKVKGYYLGLVHYGNISGYDYKKSVLFEFTDNNISKNGYLYNSNRPFFEVFLDADHGSTINYKKEKNEVVPVLNELEKEQYMYFTYIKPIQANIFRKFSIITNILKDFYYDSEKVEKMFNRKFFDLVYLPSLREIELYNSFYHFENFGIMTYSTFKNNNKLDLKHKLYNYYHFHSFIQNDSTWQYLKLYNSGMKMGIIILYIYKFWKLKRGKVI